MPRREPVAARPFRLVTKPVTKADPAALVLSDNARSRTHPVAVVLDSYMRLAYD